MKKKIVFVIYRNWAFEIFKKIIHFGKVYDFFKVVSIITTYEHEFSLNEAKKYTKVYEIDGNDNEKIYQILKEKKPEAVFFYGWSWIIKKRILKKFSCLGLHPSPLPKYRGGSPIQHQLLKGERYSAVTVFKMSEGIDNGDIYMQKPISLKGDINDIFKRMTNIGTQITRQYIAEFVSGKVKFIPQKELDKYSPLKRRKPEDSRIELKDLDKMSFKYIYNLVRGLLNPFPNAYMIIGNSKLTIQKVKKVNEIKKNDMVITAGIKKIPNSRDLVIKVSDGYAKLVNYKLEKT